jgi:hypothetical protein
MSGAGVERYRHAIRNATLEISSFDPVINMPQDARESWCRHVVPEYGRFDLQNSIELSLR